MPIYDRSYRRWSGQLRRHPTRWLPIAAAGIALAFRARSKPAYTVAFYVFLLAAFAPFVMVLLINYFMNQPVEKIEEVLPSLAPDLVPLSALKAAQYPFLVAMRPQLVLVILTLMFGAHLIARDRATLAIPLYLSRPLTRLDYLLGKLSVVAFFLMCFTLFPCLLIWVVDVGGSPQPGYLAQALPQLGGILVLCLTIVTVYSTTILAASSLCRRPMLAGLLWFGWVMLTELVLAPTLAEVFDEPHPLALSVQRCHSRLAYALFDLDAISQLPLGSQILKYLRVNTDIPMSWACGSVLVHVGLALWLLRRALRSEEVVQGS